MNTHEDIISVNSAKMETKYGDFLSHVFRFSNSEDIVLVKGLGSIPLLRVQSACLPSTALGSTMCDCNNQIQQALRQLSSAKFGIFVYLTEQEARGHGLSAKMEVMKHLNNGLQLREAQIAANKAPDLRTYEKIPAILKYLKIETKVDLLTNNISRAQVMEKYGLSIREVVSLV